MLIASYCRLSSKPGGSSGTFGLLLHWLADHPVPHCLFIDASGTVHRGFVSSAVRHELVSLRFAPIVCSLTE